MSENTTNLKLPFIMAAQAQKHVTHNEAIRALDALVQISVEDNDLTAPPLNPVEGASYLIAAPATGDWAGKENTIAAYQDGAWMYYEPNEGWIAWLKDENIQTVYDGTSWQILSGGGAGIASLNPATGDLLGVNSTADTTNRLTVSSPASLFDNEGNDHQLKINKQTNTDTASVLFQTGYSGRAEFGLTGDDNFHMKVSPDGTNFFEGIIIDKDTGTVTFPNTVFSGGSVSSVFGRAGAITASAGDYNYDDISGVSQDVLIGRLSSGVGEQEQLSASQVRTFLNIEDGAQLTNASNVTSAINGAVITSTTITANDKVLIQDVDDADNLKIVTAQSIADLATGGGAGDVTGPASSTDEAIAIFDTTTGKTIKNSLVTIDINGNIQTTGTVSGRNIQTDGAKLDSIETGADITDTTNVTNSLNGAPFTDVTVAMDDKVIIQDVSDSLNIKTITAQSIADLASSTATDISVGSDAQGDILYHDGTNYTRLPAGTSGKFLKTQGPASNPIWETIPGGGDLLAANNLSDLSNVVTARENLGIGASTDLFALALRVADLEGDALGIIDGIADPFDDETDVDLSSSINQVYDTTNDLYSPYGSAGGAISVTNYIGDTTNVGGLPSIFDGTTSQGKSVGARKFSSLNCYFGADFSASPKAIASAVVYGSNDVGFVNTNNPNVTLQLRGKNGTPPSGRTDGVIIGSLATFTDTSNESAGRTILMTDTTNQYDYVWIDFSRDGSGADDICIAELVMTETATISNMTLQSNAFTAQSTPATGRLCVLAKPNEAITINTDLVGYISRDDGTTFTPATLVPQITYSNGTILYEDAALDLSGQPAGTGMKWKITTGNYKDIDVSGIVMQWS